MTPTRRSFIKSTLSAGLLSIPAIHVRPKSLPAESDFIDLFDGESLSGWHKNPDKINHGTGGRWVVEDGAIVGEQDPPGSGNGGVLLTDAHFSDFELLLEIMPDWGPDSGLFLRSTDAGQCFQMMVDYHENGNVGFIYGEAVGGFGSVPFRLHAREDGSGNLVGFESEHNENYPETPLSYVCAPDVWLKAWNVGDWNRVRVVCVGEYPVIKTWINDALICEFNAATFQHPRYDREQVRATLGREGSVGVQVHGGANLWPVGAKCRWKNIKIRTL